MKTLRLIALIILIASAGQSHARTLKVMSYNIWGTYFTSNTGGSYPWQQRKLIVFDIINEQSPDLIGLQEDSLLQRDEVAAHLSLDYGLVDSLPDTLGNESYKAILYKKSKITLLTSGNFLTVAGLPRRTTWAKFQDNLTGLVFFMFNVHWNSIASSDDWLPTRLASAYSMQLQISNLNPEGLPVVLTGDLNAIITDPSILYLTSDKDTFPDLSYPDGFLKLNTPYEWEVQLDDQTPYTQTNTVDYILTSEDLTFNSAKKRQKRVNGLIASDHFALFENVVFPNNGYVPSFLVPVIDYIFNGD